MTETTVRYVEENEAVLIQRAQVGDELSFVKLMNAYRGRIQRYIRRVLGNHSDAEDIAQETFVRAYRGLSSFADRGNFQSWLFRIAFNLTIDTLRRRRPYNILSLNLPMYNDTELCNYLTDETVRDPVDEVQSSETREQVWEAISELPDKLRTVIVMYELQGHSYDSIADHLSCPQGTVKSRLFNARQKLRGKLTKRLAISA